MSIIDQSQVNNGGDVFQKTSVSPESGYGMITVTGPYTADEPVQLEIVLHENDLFDLAKEFGHGEAVITVSAAEAAALASALFQAAAGALTTTESA